MVPWSVLWPLIYFEHCLTRDLLGTAFNFRTKDRIYKVYACFGYYPLWFIPLTILVGILLPKQRKSNKRDTTVTNEDQDKDSKKTR